MLHLSFLSKLLIGTFGLGFGGVDIVVFLCHLPSNYCTKLLGCWTAPWWWTEVRNSESPERATSVFAFLSVCLCVCVSVCVSVTTLQVTVFDQATTFFKNIFFRTMGRKVLFRFLKFSFLTFLWPFKVFFGVFPLCLCNGHKPPHSTYKYNFWHVCSLWCRKSKKKKYSFWKFSFLTIWGPFLTIFDDFIEFFTSCT